MSLSAIEPSPRGTHIPFEMRLFPMDRGQDYEGDFDQRSGSTLPVIGFRYPHVVFRGSQPLPSQQRSARLESKCQKTQVCARSDISASTLQSHM